jgi:hypothetical protein
MTRVSLCSWLKERYRDQPAGLSLSQALSQQLSRTNKYVIFPHLLCETDKAKMGLLSQSHYT